MSHGQVDRSVPLAGQDEKALWKRSAFLFWMFFPGVAAISESIPFNFTA